MKKNEMKDIQNRQTNLMNNELMRLNLQKIRGQLRLIEQVGYYRWKAQYMLFYTGLVLASIFGWVIFSKWIFLAFALIGFISMLHTILTMKRY